MRVLKWYAPTDQQEITDIALHYVFEAEPGAKEYTIFASALGTLSCVHSLCITPGIKKQAAGTYVPVACFLLAVF